MKTTHIYVLVSACIYMYMKMMMMTTNERYMMEGERKRTLEAGKYCFCKRQEVEDNEREKANTQAQ